MAFLILESPNGDRNYFTLREDRTLLGRDEGNHIVIDNEYVSSFHAEFRILPDGEMELADMDSHNGTEINDQHIVEPTVLKNGDILRFGLVQGCFYEAVEDPEAESGEDGLDEAFLPDRSNSEEAESVSSHRTSTDDLDGVVLSFEEFCYASDESPERVANAEGKCLIITSRIDLAEEESAT